MSTLSNHDEAGKIPAGTLSFVGARLRGDVHDLILEAFDRSGLSQAELAERLGKDKAQICRLLGGPSNWTVDTVAQLLYAISGNFVKVLEDNPREGPIQNCTHTDWFSTKQSFGDLISCFPDPNSRPVSLTSVTFACPNVDPGPQANAMPSGVRMVVSKPPLPTGGVATRTGSAHSARLANEHGTL